MTLQLSQVMELWLQESHKCEIERTEENERRKQEWKEAEARQEEWRRKEEEWMEEQRAQRSEDLMRTIVATLAEREPRRPRTEFGIDSPKLTKLTFLDDIEAFMMMFKRLMEAPKIEQTKWLVLLVPQLTEKVEQAYASLSS